MKKTIFLILTLAIPVSIFLFLKIFGTNEFEVPFLFEKGVPGCPNDSIPHKVPDIEYIGETEKQFNSSRFTNFMVYGIFDADNPEQNRNQIVELIRIQDAFYEIGAPGFVMLVQGEPYQRLILESQCKTMGFDMQKSSIAYLEKSVLDDFVNCGLGLQTQDAKSTEFVLVDPQKNVRGIYNSAEVEQTDRLILELKILKKEK